MNRLIGVILTVLIILSLVACSSGSAKKLPGEPATPESVLGTWRIDTELDSNKLMEIAYQMIGGGGKENAAEQTEFMQRVFSNVTIRPLHFCGTYEFRSNGEVRSEMDEATVDATYAWMEDLVKQTLPYILSYRIDQEIKKKGLNTTVEAYVLQNHNQSFEEFVSQQTEFYLKYSLPQIKDGMAKAGTQYYSVEDGKLYLWEEDEPKPEDYIVARIENGNLFFVEVVGNTTFSQAFTVLAPVSLTRVGESS